MHCGKQGRKQQQNVFMRLNLNCYYCVRAVIQSEKNISIFIFVVRDFCFTFINSTSLAISSSLEKTKTHLLIGTFIYKVLTNKRKKKKKQIKNCKCETKRKETNVNLEYRVYRN